MRHWCLTESYYDGKQSTGRSIKTKSRLRSECWFNYEPNTQQTLCLSSSVKKKQGPKDTTTDKKTKTGSVPAGAGGGGGGGFCRASRQSVCGLDGRLACNTRSLHRIQHVSRGPGYASCPRPPTRHSIHPHALTRCVIPITTRRRARQRAAAWLGRWSSSTSSSGRAAHGVLSPLSLPLMDSPFLWNIASSHRGKCLCVCVCVCVCVCDEIRGNGTVIVCVSVCWCALLLSVAEASSDPNLIRTREPRYTRRTGGCALETACAPGTVFCVDRRGSMSVFGQTPVSPAATVTALQRLLTPLQGTVLSVCVCVCRGVYCASRRRVQRSQYFIWGGCL